MRYLELKISTGDLDTGILIAQLSEEGFDSFQEEQDYLLAFIAEDTWQTSKDSTFIRGLSGSYEHRYIKDQNWNKEWESNFSPIKVGNCMIRASFHEPSEELRYDIVIDPKMSFGTGHHETTYMMIEKLLDLDLSDLHVLDAGCGTGILSILAEKKGARKVLGFDIEEWAVTNTRENLDLNDCMRTSVFQGTIKDVKSGREYDQIIANIHKNVLIDEMTEYVERLKLGGLLLLSGFYERDRKDIDREAAKTGLISKGHSIRNNWCCSTYQLPLNDNLRN